MSSRTTGRRIAAVVVNHNTREHLRRCLAAVLADRPAQTIVVDTGSNDGSADLVRRDFPLAELVEIENRGYGAGANAGLRRVRTSHALLLNADTRPASGTLAALAGYFAQNARAAVVGPLLLDAGGRRQVTARRFPTPLEVFLQESGLHRLLPGKLADHAPRRVDWVLGAALAVRCEAMSEVGGFDESYFMYNEEVDLCVRLWRAGWEVHYAPVTPVVHVGGASTSQHRAAMVEQYVRSTLALYRRHFSPKQQVQLIAILAAALLARSARDRARLLCTIDRERRRVLRLELEGWRSARAALRGV